MIIGILKTDSLIVIIKHARLNQLFLIFLKIENYPFYWAERIIIVNFITISVI